MTPTQDSTTARTVRGARTISGTIVDIVMSDGVIVELLEKTSPGVAGTDHDIDARGYLVVPSLVEPHAHLDKAFLSERIDNPTGDLMGAIRGIEASRLSLTFDDTVERAERAVHLMASRGVQLIRSHADTTIDSGLQNVEALLEVKRRCSTFVDLQVAALIGWPLSGLEGADNRALAKAAIASGVDVIGGCPHLDTTPAEALSFLFDLACEKGVALDLHADENTRSDSFDLERCADLVLSSASTIDIAASHCVALGVIAEEVQRRIVAKVSEAGINIITLPLTNLYLQGRGSTSQTPRGLTPISLLRTHGVTVAAGGDNLQDPFNPLGKGDPLETANYLVLAGHVLIDEALDAVTSSARRALGCAPVDISVGAPADFVLIKADSVREAIAMQTTDRVVIRHGRRAESRL